MLPPKAVVCDGAAERLAQPLRLKAPLTVACCERLIEEVAEAVEERGAERETEGLPVPSCDNEGVAEAELQPEAQAVAAPLALPAPPPLLREGSAGVAVLQLLAEGVLSAPLAVGLEVAEDRGERVDEGEGEGEGGADGEAALEAAALPVGEGVAVAQAVAAALSVACAEPLCTVEGVAPPSEKEAMDVALPLGEPLLLPPPRTSVALAALEAVAAAPVALPPPRRLCVAAGLPLARALVKLEAEGEPLSPPHLSEGVPVPLASEPEPENSGEREAEDEARGEADAEGGAVVVPLWLGGPLVPVRSAVGEAVREELREALGLLERVVIVQGVAEAEGEPL